MKDGHDPKPGKKGPGIEQVNRELQGDLLADAVTGLFAADGHFDGVEPPVESGTSADAAGERTGEEPEGTEAQDPGPLAPEGAGGEPEHDSEEDEERGTELIPDSLWEQKMSWAKQRAKDGRLEEAEELYRELIEEDPSNVRALNNLGVLLDEMGDPEGALAYLRTARKIEPTNQEVLGNLGAALASLGRYAEAEEELRQALKLDSANLQIRANLGILLFRRGLYDLAVAELDSVCKSNPDDGMTHYYRGEALNRLGRVEEAIEALERVTELIPGNPKAYYTLGVLFDKKNLSDRAATMYRKARQLTDS